MFELIKIDINENGDVVVFGRDLHEFLEVDTRYSIWMPRMIDYGFIENKDFKVCCPNLDSKQHGGKNKVNHILKINMAKEIAMIQRTEKGKQIRQYFIEVEEEYNSPEKVMARALRIANKSISDLVVSVKNLKRRQGEINNRKTATAMATASVKSREIEELKIRLAESEKFKTVKGYALKHNFKIPKNLWKMLGRKATKISDEIGISKKYIEDERLVKIGVYQIEALQRAFAEYGYGEETENS